MEQILIILIQPNHKVVFSTSNPPLGLGYLASSLRAAGHKVTILDCVLLKWDNETVEKELVNFQKKHKIDIIGTGALTSFYQELKDLCHRIKNNSLLQKIPLIIGGIHPSFLPEITLRESGADFVVCGEGERTFVELLEIIEKNTKNYSKIKGIGYLDEHNNFLKTESQQYIQNLDSIPFPSWDLIDPRLYPPIPFGTIAKNVPIAPILTTRGCPYRCAFCASKNFWGSKLRKRSSKNVVSEIEWLYNSFGIKEFHIWDDNFTLDRNHAISICKEIIQKNININLALPNGVRIDKLDKELLYYLKKAGFYTITVAVESGNQKILDRANKALNLSNVPPLTNLLKRMGFLIQAYFILGLPGETIKTIHDTLKLSMNIEIDRISYFIASPIPGSELFEDWLTSQKLTMKDLTGFNWKSILFIGGGQYSLCNLKYKELVNFQRYAYRKFLIKHFKDFLLISIKFFKVRQLKYRLSQIFFFLKKK